MTNQQWLATLDPAEWWNVIDWLFHNYGKRYTESRLAIIDWLAEEHEPADNEDETAGHWIVLDDCANAGIYCSQCSNKIFDRTSKPKKKLSNFCPNCGSRNERFYNPSTGKYMGGNNHGNENSDP